MIKIKRLVDGHSRLFTFLGAVIILLVFYHVRRGLNIFNPWYVNWLVAEPELANGFFSFGFFRYQDWGLPLGNINAYFYPLGTNIYTTDIPLLALLCKPFSFVFPPNFQYVGFWYLVSHLLQAWFSILLCERLGIKGFTKMCVVIFFLFSPVLLSRFLHPTLFSQWIFLAAVWIYLIDPKKTPVRKILFYQLLLFLLSGLVFAYLWAMIFGFSVALLLRLWLIDKKLNFYKALLSLSSHVALMALFWLLIGLITLEGLPDYTMPGWGFFSINLNSLYNPMSFHSSFLPASPYFVDQLLEGYAYLGVGILVLLALSILLFAVTTLLKKQSRPFHFLTIENINILPLLLFLAFSTVYALSNRVSFNQSILFEYKISDVFSNLVNSFRASGRFFWPVYYFIIIFLFHIFNRLPLGSISKNLIVGSCLALQLYDIQFFLKPGANTYETYKPPINNFVWERLIKSFDITLFYPGYRRSYLSFDDYRYFSYYAVMHKKKINIGYPARFDVTKVNAAIRDMGDEITANGLDEHSLYVTTYPELNRLVLPLALNGAYCFTIDGYLVMFKKTKSTEGLYQFIEQEIGKDQRDEVIAHLMARRWSGHIDSVSTKNISVGIYQSDETASHFFIKGFGFLDASTDIPHDSIYLVLESISKRRWITPLHRFGTSDVADYYHRLDLQNSGFSASLLKKNLPNGIYDVGLYFLNTTTHAKTFYWLDHHIKVDRETDASLVTTLYRQPLGLKSNMYAVENSPATVYIECYAFPNGGFCASCKPYFTFRSSSLRYEIEATAIPKPEVGSFFHDSSVINSGLSVTLRKSSMQKGAYRLGILLKDTLRNQNYFSNTDSAVMIGYPEFAVTDVLKVLPQSKDSIRGFIDNVVEGESFFRINGWAVMQQMRPADTETWLVLQANGISYSMETTTIIRDDIQSYLNLSYNAEMSGFSAKFRKEELLPGKYQVLIMMLNKKTNTKSLLRCADQIIIRRPLTPLYKP